MKERKGILLALGALIVVIAGAFTSGKGEGGLFAWVLSLAKTALWGIGIFVVVLLAIVVVGIILASRGEEKEKKKSRQTPLQEKEEALLAAGRKHLMQLRITTNKASDVEIRNAGTRICDSADKICTTLKEKPELISAARKYLNYYLPTMETVMEKYVGMEKNGVAEGDLREKVLVFLQNALTATEKQYRSLFEAEALDMTVEMAVMTDICKQEGLLTAEELAVAEDENDEGGISLTL